MAFASPGVLAARDSALSQSVGVSGSDWAHARGSAALGVCGEVGCRGLQKQRSSHPPDRPSHLPRSRDYR